MKKTRYTEEQIAYVLREAESGTAVADVCRSIGVSEATFYVWKKKYANLGVSELSGAIWTWREPCCCSYVEEPAQSLWLTASSPLTNLSAHPCVEARVFQDPPNRDPSSSAWETSLFLLPEHGG